MISVLSFLTITEFLSFLTIMDSVLTYAPATFTMNMHGDAVLSYEGVEHKCKNVRSCGWEKYKLPRVLRGTNATSEYKYTFYVYDNYGGYPYFIKHKETLQQLVDGYKKAQKDVDGQRQRQKEEKAAKEAAAKAATARIFPVKGSAAPTNPWKKPV